MSFENIALSSLINNEPYSKRVAVHLKEEYFEDPANREVFKLFKRFVGKYNTIPNKTALAVMLSEEKMPESMYAQASIALGNVAEMESNSNIDFLYDETEKWAKDRVMYLAVMQAIGIIQGEDKALDREAIPEIMTNALALSFDTSIGHDYFANAEEQWEYYSDPGERFKFDIETMNRITKGGVKKKTLNIVQMGINIGKTTWMIQQAAHWLNMGKNVVYFTMEVAEEVIRERADVRLMDTNFDALHVLEKEQYFNRINKLRLKTQGEFIIKEFAANTAHVGHFRHVLRELILKRGVKVDMICVDHLTLVASSRLPAAAASNSNLYYTSVAEELRGLGKEFDLPVWTASQFTRSGQDGDKNIGVGDTGLAIGIPATADFMVAFMQPDELAPQNKIIGKVIKNRYAGKHKIGKFIMGSDPDRQCFYDLDEREQAAVMTADEYTTMQQNAVSTKTTPVTSTAGFNYG